GDAAGPELRRVPAPAVVVAGADILLGPTAARGEDRSRSGHGDPSCSSSSEEVTAADAGAVVRMRHGSPLDWPVGHVCTPIRKRPLAEIAPVARCTSAAVDPRFSERGGGASPQAEAS